MVSRRLHVAKWARIEPSEYNEYQFQQVKSSPKVVLSTQRRTALNLRSMGQFSISC